MGAHGGLSAPVGFASTDGLDACLTKVAVQRACATPVEHFYFALLVIIMIIVVFMSSSSLRRQPPPAKPGSTKPRPGLRRLH